MDLKRIAKEYILANRAEADNIHSLSLAMKNFNPDNDIFFQSTPFSHAYHDLVKEIVGDVSYEWIDWFCWETDFGTRPDFECSFGTGDPLRAYTFDQLDEFLDKVFSWTNELQ